MQLAQYFILEFAPEPIYEYQFPCFSFDTDLRFDGWPIATVGTSRHFEFDVHQSAWEQQNVYPQAK
jgi:hypothetical protein